jgi:hypothetical protein
MVEPSSVLYLKLLVRVGEVEVGEFDADWQPANNTRLAVAAQRIFMLLSDYCPCRLMERVAREPAGVNAV